MRFPDLACNMTGEVVASIPGDHFVRYVNKILMMDGDYFGY